MNYDQDSAIETKGQFSYNFALLFHIDRISKLITSYPIMTGKGEQAVQMTNEQKGFIMESFYESVELLESMLSPYFDNEYQQGINAIKKLYEEGKKLSWFKLGKRKYTLLLKLMDRLNLLLEKTTTGEIK